MSSKEHIESKESLKTEEENNQSTSDGVDSRIKELKEEIEGIKRDRREQIKAIWKEFKVKQIVCDRHDGLFALTQSGGIFFKSDCNEWIQIIGPVSQEITDTGKYFREELDFLRDELSKIMGEPSNPENLNK